MSERLISNEKRDQESLPTSNENIERIISEKLDIIAWMLNIHILALVAFCEEYKLVFCGSELAEDDDSDVDERLGKISDARHDLWNRVAFLKMFQKNYQIGSPVNNLKNLQLLEGALDQVCRYKYEQVNILVVLGICNPDNIVTACAELDEVNELFLPPLDEIKYMIFCCREKIESLTSNHLE